MSNIWNIITEFPGADYYDFHTGRIYHNQEYTQAKNENRPTPCEELYGFPGILVSQDGNIIGAVREPGK